MILQISICSFYKLPPIVIKLDLFLLPIIVRKKIFINLLEKQDGINLLCVGTIQNIFVDFYNCNSVKWFIILWTIQKANNGTFVL